jgi:integrase
MSTIDQYIAAATRDNTRQSYQAAVRHFEIHWGGHLPATALNVASYLTAYGDKLSNNTLRLRLAALSQWHIDQGFVDPTKSPLVRKVFKGIRALHPTEENSAKALQLEDLDHVIQWLDGQILRAQTACDRAAELRYLRDKSLFLLGFWRGFRGDELTSLQARHVTVTPGAGMSCYFPHTKSDRANAGSTYKAPALPRLCPVDAYQAWVSAAQISTGPVYRAVDRWGAVAETALHPDSLIPIFRSVLEGAGIPSPKLYSAHSLRRGFANWATLNGWDLKTLMKYVGWKDMKSAMRYIDEIDPFFRHKVKADLAVRSEAVRLAHSDSVLND